MIYHMKHIIYFCFCRHDPVLLLPFYDVYVSFRSWLWQTNVLQKLGEQGHQLYARNSWLSDEDCCARALPVCFAQEVWWEFSKQMMTICMIWLSLYEFLNTNFNNLPNLSHPTFPNCLGRGNCCLLNVRREKPDKTNIWGGEERWRCPKTDQKSLIRKSLAQK